MQLNGHRAVGILLDKLDKLLVALDVRGSVGLVVGHSEREILFCQTRNGQGQHQNQREREQYCFFHVKILLFFFL